MAKKKESKPGENFANTAADLQQQEEQVCFRDWLLPRLRRKTAFLCCKEPETQSGILEMFQLQGWQRDLSNPLYP